MQVLLINLARRRDRLDAMTAQLTRLALSATRIPALDANTVSQNLLAQFFSASGPLGTVPKGDQCCSLSHRRAWSVFLAGSEPYATVLEDDVILDPATAPLLRHCDWIGDDVDVVKLEHFGPQNQRVLVGERRPVPCGRNIAPILSRHTGGGAYVISRAAAIKLLAVEHWSVPVDHLLFNPNVSPLAEDLRAFQLLPAIARQGEGPSDIRHWRLADRRPNLKLVRREIVRAYYECRLLPKQIAAVLGGKARLMRVAGPAADLAPALQEFVPARTGTR